MKFKLNKKTKFSDYFKLYREFKESREEFENFKKVKIAILSSFTISQLEPLLFVENLKNDIYSEIYIPGFNQFRQEILNKGSYLHIFKPDIIFFVLRVEDIINDYFVIEEKKRKRLSEELIDDMKFMFKKLFKLFNSSVFFNTFFLPQYIPNLFLNFQELNSSYNMLKGINREIRKELNNYVSAYIYSFDVLFKENGISNVFDAKMEYYAAIPFKSQFLIEIAEYFSRMLKILLFPRKKCLVLDLDNTLWGGIIGEDGLNGIKIGGTFPGNVYAEIQKVIKYYKDQGIILTINSKNNMKDVLEVFEKHNDMVLKLEDFSSVKINWNEKADNMIEISNELNIGLDSMVFVDDSPVEREKIHQFLPMVEVMEFGKDPLKNLEILKKTNYFDSFFLTDEDRKKSREYEERKKRTKTLKKIKNQDDFIKNLNLKVNIKPIDRISFKRVYQLIQKTNQFNLNAKRYSEGELKNMMNKQKECEISYIKAEDKFGEYGIIGVIITKIDKENLIIDSLLLSCRAIGVGIEKVIMKFLIEKAKRKKLKKIIAIYKETKKNTLVKGFLTKEGFIKRKEVFELSLQKEMRLAEILKFIDYSFD